jgi:hypothetical protein
VRHELVDKHPLGAVDAVVKAITHRKARRPTKVAAIALANKIARMAWAMDGPGVIATSEPVALAA